MKIYSIFFLDCAATLLGLTFTCHFHRADQAFIGWLENNEPREATTPNRQF